MTGRSRNIGLVRAPAATMPTFIDESGDTGPYPPSNVHYFRLAAVWVPTREVADVFRVEVGQLRRELGLPSDYEFKFSETGDHPARREGFFRCALRQEFRFAVAAIDKRDARWGAAGAAVLHWATAVSLAACLRPTYHGEEARRVAGGWKGPLNELVVVDDNQDKQFLDTVKRTFRDLNSADRPGQRRGSALVGKVKFRGSGPDELLQLADMVCGAVGNYLDGVETWFRLISPRSVGVIGLP